MHHQKTPDIVQSKLNRVDIQIKPDITGHSELELSTDNSDDDSLMGEPDSSHPNSGANPSTLKIAVDLLKNGSNENNEKILNLIKYLVKENVRLKQNSFDYKNKIDQLLHNEDMMRKEQERLNRQIIVLQQNRNSAIASSSGSSSSISSISSCSESNSYEERRKSIVEKPDVITKPLKKSIRLTPIENVHQSSVHYNDSIDDKEDNEDNELSHSIVKIEKL